VLITYPEYEELESKLVQRGEKWIHVPY
jgi:hypothetical protein